MTVNEIISADLNAIYAEAGESANYNGAAITVCCWREHGLQDAGDFVREEASCRVRRSEVATINKGADVVDYSGVSWAVDDVSLSNRFEHVLVLVRNIGGQL